MFMRRAFRPLYCRLDIGHGVAAPSEHHHTRLQTRRLREASFKWLPQALNMRYHAHRMYGTFSALGNHLTPVLLHDPVMQAIGCCLRLAHHLLQTADPALPAKLSWCGMPTATATRDVCLPATALVSYRWDVL